MKINVECTYDVPLLEDSGFIEAVDKAIESGLKIAFGIANVKECGSGCFVASDPMERDISFEVNIEV